MPRGRKKYTLEEKIDALQETITAKEQALAQLKEELTAFLAQKEQEELAELNKALKESGRTAAELLGLLEAEKKSINK